MPWTPARTAAAVALLALSLAGSAACSAGTSEPVARDVGHGAIVDLLRVLEQQGAPCTGDELREPVPALYEEAATCTLDGAKVDIWHFADQAQAQAFRASILVNGGHGAFGPGWALTVADRADAERLADLLRDAEPV